MRTLRPYLASLAVLCLAWQARSEELLPANRSIESVIDHYIDALLKAEEVTPAPQADDATILRRWTLDLVGRVPTPAEVDEFLKSTDPQKRQKTVDRLIASPGFIRHQAAQFDVMLNSAGANERRRGGVQDYLQSALANGKTWDKIFRELMLPDENDPNQKGASEYLRSRTNDLDRLTNDVSVAFFGVNVSCAQCHDHPHAVDWKQDHFYGMKSFFARTYDAGGFLGEREAGLIKFKPTRGPERQAKLMFLTGFEVKTDTLRDPTKDEQKKEKELTDKAKSSKKAPPPPSFSARAKLVDLALKEGQSEFFARSIVNRMWHRFFGYGLVNPLDQMHSENPASHPELMVWLARDTATHGYDLRRIVRGISLSKTYSRSSRYSSESQPSDKYFAVAQLRAMTPMQLATSMRLVTADPATYENLKPADLEKKIEGIESSARGFSSLIAQPTDDFQIGVSEALLFSNSDRITKEFLTDSGGSLLGRIKNLKNPQEAIALMVKTVYSRPATEKELTTLSEYVRKRNDRSGEAYRQVLWALLTSAEFRFCY